MIEGPRIDLVNNEIDRLLARIEALESENGAMLVDLTALAMFFVDACDICKHNVSRSPCENYDYDCALCNAVGCVCAACRNSDRFEWCGMRAPRLGAVQKKEGMNRDRIRPTGNQPPLYPRHPN